MYCHCPHHVIQILLLGFCALGAKAIVRCFMFRNRATFVTSTLPILCCIIILNRTFAEVPAPVRYQIKAGSP